MALLARYAVMLKQSGCARHDAQSKCHARCAPWVLLPHDNGPPARERHAFTTQQSYTYVTWSVDEELSHFMRSAVRRGVKVILS